MRRWLADRAVEWRWLDWPLAVVVVWLHIWLVWATGRFDLLRTTGFTNRLSLYTDMITVTGVLLGFAATALASYLAFSSGPIASFRAHSGEKVIGQWMSALIGLGLTLVALVFCKILDREVTSAAGMRWIAEGALIFAASRTARLVWVFQRIVTIATRTSESRQPRTEPINVR
jgi:hypothetical protein